MRITFLKYESDIEIECTIKTDKVWNDVKRHLKKLGVQYQALAQYMNKDLESQRDLKD